MFNSRRWLLYAIRHSLIRGAIVVLLLSLLTAFKWPLWMDWMATLWPMGMVVPEISHWLAAVPLCFAAGAWFLRRGHPVISTATIAFCVAAFLLFLKPSLQAWQLGRTLPAQLTAAFGPAAPNETPFSMSAAIFPRTPAPVAIESMEYSNHLMLDFYRAVGRNPAPCVIVVHGGSWVGGNRMDDGTQRWLNDWLAARGYAVASIDYRLAPQFLWPAQRDDLLAAVDFLRAHAAKLGIDPKRFVLLGRSAGGQMVTATAYWKPDPGIRGVIAIYPVTDFNLTYESATHPGNMHHQWNLEIFLGGTPQTAAAAYESASGARLVQPGDPPTLIFQGDLDINVFKEQGEVLDEKLAAAGVPHALVLLPWAAHAFDLVYFDSPGAQIATYAIDHFLQAVTR